MMQIPFKKRHVILLLTILLALILGFVSLIELFIAENYRIFLRRHFKSPDEETAIKIAEEINYKALFNVFAIYDVDCKSYVKVNEVDFSHEIAAVFINNKTLKIFIEKVEYRKRTMSAFKSVLTYSAYCDSLEETTLKINITRNFVYIIKVSVGNWTIIIHEPNKDPMALLFLNVSGRFLTPNESMIKHFSNVYVVFMELCYKETHGYYSPTHYATTFQIVVLDNSYSILFMASHAVLAIASS